MESQMQTLEWQVSPDALAILLPMKFKSLSDLPNLSEREQISRAQQFVRALSKEEREQLRREYTEQYQATIITTPASQRWK